MTDAIATNRLRWKCRRGLLELDLLLERYLRSHPGDAELAELLDFPDTELWEIASGRSERYPPHLKDVVARVRAA